MAIRKPDKPRGVLNLTTNQGKFQLRRYLPSKDISFFVEHYWFVKWNLPGESCHMQETLPHPSIHLVIENGGSEIVGVVEKKYTRILKGSGFVFGIKFKPGGFYPFAGFPVSEITNKVIGLSDVFGKEGVKYEKNILSVGNEERMVEIAEDFLNKKLPGYDENILIINNIIEKTIKDREITKVEDIVSGFIINKRKLQRLFSLYVGVSPKWVIKRYRLHEAVEQLDTGNTVDFTKLALDLGYFDQPHFIKDFKALIGKTPEEYMKRKEV